jgi:hypothetical protein
MSLSWVRPSPGIAARGREVSIPAHVDHVHGMPPAWLSAAAPATVALADAETIEVDASVGNDFTVTPAGNRTLGNPSGGSQGQLIRVHVTQDAAGSRTLAYGTAYSWGAAGAPVLTTATGKTDVLEFVYNAAAGKWFGLRAVKGF